MTSLIDVIFLLLLFFMLTSTFTRFAEIPLTSGAAGTAAALADTPPALVQLSQQGIRMNGYQIAEGGLLAAIDALQEVPEMLIVTLSDDVNAQSLVDLLVQVQQRPSLAVSVLE